MGKKLKVIESSAPRSRFLRVAKIKEALKAAKGHLPTAASIATNRVLSAGEADPEFKAEFQRYGIEHFIDKMLESEDAMNEFIDRHCEQSWWPRFVQIMQEAIAKLDSAKPKAKLIASLER